MTAPKRLRIAVLLDHIESDYHIEVLQGVLRAARSARARVLVIPGGWIAKSPAEPVVRNFLYDLLATARFDGLLILAGSLSNHSGLPAFLEWVERYRGIPCAFVGVDLPDRPSTYVDNEAGVYGLVTHLLGHHKRRRIAFIRGPSESPEAEARRRAYLRALEEHGIPADPRLIVQGSFARELGPFAVQQLLDEHRFTPATLDAIVGVNDGVALGALDELTRRGITVPDQIAVVGFDDTADARAANPPLTTVTQRVELQSYTATKVLLDYLEHGKPLDSQTLQPELVIRASCGCISGFLNDSAALRPPAGGLARTCRLALIERRPMIMAELSRAAAGRLAGMSGWESRLLDALNHALAAASMDTLVRELEHLTRRSVAQGHDVTVCHDVLTALRLQALACAALEPESRPRLEDMFQESRITISRIGTDVERDRHRRLDACIRRITRGCLATSANGDLQALAEILGEDLPTLGITAFTISRLTGATGPDVELSIVARRSEGLWSSNTSVVRARDLGLDPALEQEETIVIEPLEHAGRAAGIAAFAWGAHNPVHYEQLRELIGAAVGALDPTSPGSTSGGGS